MQGSRGSTFLTDPLARSWLLFQHTCNTFSPSLIAFHLTHAITKTTPSKNKPQDVQSCVASQMGFSQEICALLVSPGKPRSRLVCLLNCSFHKIPRRDARKPVLEAGETPRLQITAPAQSFLGICYGVLSQQPRQLPLVSSQQ